MCKGNSVFRAAFLHGENRSRTKRHQTQREELWHCQDRLSRAFYPWRLKLRSKSSMVPSGSQLSERPRCGIYKGSRIGSKRRQIFFWRLPQHRQLQPSLSSFSLPALSSMTWFEDHLQGDQKEQREGDGKQEKRCGWRKLSQ